MGRLVAMVVAAVGVAAALYLSLFLTELDREQSKARVQAKMLDTSATLTERFRKARILLDTYKALYVASESVSQEELQEFTTALYSHVAPVDRTRSVGVEYGWIEWSAKGASPSILVASGDTTRRRFLTAAEKVDLEPEFEQFVKYHKTNIMYSAPFSGVRDQPLSNAITLIEPVLQSETPATGRAIARTEIRGFIFATIDVGQLIGDLVTFDEAASYAPAVEQVYPVELQIGDGAGGPSATFISNARAEAVSASDIGLHTRHFWVDDWRFDLQFEVTYPDRSQTLLNKSTLFPLGIIIATMLMVSYVLVIDQQKRAFRRARVAAEEANEQKDRFLANMTHELRTPMSGVIGMARLIAKSPLDKKQQSFMGKLVMSAETLMSTINNILDLSKLDNNMLELNLEPGNIDECLRNIVTPLKLLAEEKGLKLTLTRTGRPFRTVMIDELRLRQVITNLVGNAIKFTDQGGIKIRIDGRSPADKDGTRVLQVVVEDSGLGIPLAAQERIFEQFVQADISTTKKFGGTGLGLSICKKLVETMEGRIWVDSQPGVGSTFTFSIPVALAAEAAESEPVEQAILLDELPAAGAAVVPEPKAPVRKRTAARKAAAGSKQPQSKATRPQPAKSAAPALKALLVEDDPVNRLFAEETLSEHGFHVTTACDGSQGVERAREGVFDVILMDCQMPVMDGFDASREIGRLVDAGELPPTPIVALTANALRGDRERCLDAGMSEYLSKPLDDDRLREVFSALGVGRRAQQPGLAESEAGERESEAAGAENQADAEPAAARSPVSVSAPARAPEKGAPQVVVKTAQARTPVRHAEPSRSSTRIKSKNVTGAPVAVSPARGTRPQAQPAQVTKIGGARENPSLEAGAVADEGRKAAPAQSPQDAAMTGKSTQDAPVRSDALHSQQIDLVQFEMAKRKMKSKLPQIVRIYIEDSRSQLAAIEAQLANREVTDILRHAHTIKGSSRLIGASASSEAAASLETLVKGKSASDVDFDLANFECERLRSSLESAYTTLEELVLDMRAA